MAQQSPTAQGFVFRNSIIDAQRNASMPSILYGQTNDMPPDDSHFHAVAAPPPTPPAPEPHIRAASPRTHHGQRQHAEYRSASQPPTPNLSIFPADHGLHEPKHSSSRSISPIGNLAPVPPAFTEVHDVHAARRATISRPSTPRGISTRASFSQNSPRGTLERGIVMNEKPRTSRSRLREHSPGGMSFTSTVRPTNRKTYLINGQTTFAQRVFDAGKRDLLYDLKQSSRVPWRFKDDKQGTLDLSTLLRMQQHVLQQKIVEQVRAIGERGAWMEIGVGETLKEYCQTARDLDYMLQTSSLLPAGNPDPFLLSTSDPLQSLLLEEGQLVARRPHPELDNPLLTPRLPTLKRTPSARRRLRRILGVVAAVVALLVPYLLATLVKGELARVVVACACIALFAMGAVISRMPGLVAGLATLAYAAAVTLLMGVKPAYYFADS